MQGIGEVRPGDDVARLIVEAAAARPRRCAAGDVLVISQKIVSKAEGRLLRLADVAALADRGRHGRGARPATRGWSR